jgi:hypothetical protein
MLADAVVEFENVEQGREFGVLAARGDVDAGDQPRGEAGVAAAHGEHGGQAQGVDAGPAAEVIGDADPQQGRGQRPGLGDLLQQRLKVGSAARRPASPARPGLGSQVPLTSSVRSRARMAMRLQDMRCAPFGAVGGAPVGAGGGGQSAGWPVHPEEPAR